MPKIMAVLPAVPIMAPNRAQPATVEMPRPAGALPNSLLRERYATGPMPVSMTSRPMRMKQGSTRNAEEIV